MRESPRMRRLRSDQRALENLRAESSIIEFECQAAHDRPPELYLIRFRGNGAWRPEGSSTVVLRERHEFHVRLGANYPRMMPELAWKTPIFHPNISSSGFVCLGGYGTYWAPSLNLDELCVMLWDMVRYENYDVNSPYNREAALWAKTQREYPLPLDARPLRDRRANAALASIREAQLSTSLIQPAHTSMSQLPVSQFPVTQIPVSQIPASQTLVSQTPASQIPQFPASQSPFRQESPPQPEILFLDSVVVAEVVPTRDPELLIIE